YLNNVQTGQDGVNKTTADGGYLAALWRPSEAVSLKVGVLVQHATADGSSYVELVPGLADLQQSELRGTGGDDQNHELYTAKLQANLDNVHLDLISGYSIIRRSDVLDLTPMLGSLAAAAFGPGVTGVANVESDRNSQFTQEVRLSASIGSKVDWLVG